MSDENKSEESRREGRPAGGRPSKRDCKIYERHILQGETQQVVAAAFGLTQPRIAQVAARVEAWIAAHPEHRLAQRMRLRCTRRWEAIWSRAIASFDRSREDRETKKERVARRGSPAGDDDPPLTTVTERATRQQNGDPRYLQIAAKVAARQDGLWIREESTGKDTKAADDARGGPNAHESCDVAGQTSHELGCNASRFAYLPAALADLEHLACGLSPDKAMPVSTQFEQRCAEAFRSLGFDVRELGQGCGRVADCLAVAAVERFAVIIDAKVRRRGYTLGTDDRQFCEYATRHTRELALSGIDRVYFAVVGSGFRQDDLDKLATFMTGTPIRSVCFLEAAGLMRLVNDSIARRREFRLADIDTLLFGNKIITEEGLRS